MCVCRKTVKLKKLYNGEKREARFQVLNSISCCFLCQSCQNRIYIWFKRKVYIFTNQTEWNKKSQWERAYVHFPFRIKYVKHYQ